MAGAQDTDELRVAAHGDLYFAPSGTALPESVDEALNAAFYKAGYASEDGVTLNAEPEIEEHRVWQRRQPARRELTGQNITAQFALAQWNAENIKFAFGGGEVSEPSPGEFRYDFPDDSAVLDERALVIDWQDGDAHSRIVLKRGNVMEGVETQFTRGALALMPITFGVLAPESGSPGYWLFDDPAFHS